MLDLFDQLFTANFDLVYMSNRFNIANIIAKQHMNNQRLYFHVFSQFFSKKSNMVYVYQYTNIALLLNAYKFINQTRPFTKSEEQMLTNVEEKLFDMLLDLKDNKNNS